MLEFSMAQTSRLRRREKLADKLMSWGNMVFAGLVLSQMFNISISFSFGAAFSGIFIWIFSYLLAYILMKGGDRA